MLIKPILLKHLTTTLIGPHGITDIIHANNTNNFPEISQTYGSVIGSTLLLSQGNMTPIVDIIFFIASIIHFRRDMPIIKSIPRYFWSTSLLLFTINYSPELFIIYMLTVHVPHHYSINWEYMEQTPRFSVLLLVVTSTLMGVIGNSFEPGENMNLIITITKGIVLSHIAYEELYIFKNNVIEN